VHRVKKLLLVMLLAGRAFAQSSGEEKELADLLAVLQQDTAVATKTRLNSDYVPGIVTVLQGSELEAMGFETAWDALRLVPGMQPVLDPRGAPSVIVRGIEFPFNSGNIQILVNSTPLTRADAGINSSVLLIPIEDIERIEVIRGPGSVIYGDFAFMGLVNIITRRESGAFVRGATRMLSAGGDAAWRSGPVTGSLALSGAGSDDAPVTQLRHVHERRWFGNADVAAGGFALSVQEARRTYDPTAIGGPSALHVDETLRSIEGRYARDLAPKLHGEAKVTYLDTDATDGISLFAGHLTRGALQVTSDRWARQSWLAGADYSVSTTDHAAHAAPPPPGAPPPSGLTPLVANVDRRITGVFAQDTIALTSALDFTLGARYDSYSDLQSRTTPRASLVWRASEHHIVKAQYAEGFRPPTFFELYQPPARGTIPRYPFEVNRTSELNYIYKATNRVGRATLFHTAIDDMIRPGGVVTPGHARATGFELEWEQQISAPLKVDADVSRVHAEDPRIIAGQTVRDRASAEWLGNAGLLYEPVHGTLLSARVSHVGDRVLATGWDSVDVTLSRAVVRGLTLRAGVKDAFNQQISYALVLPTGQGNVLQYPRRSAWVQLAWKR
jgi:outer membrane receptor for ferrienterochelin and colicins